MCLSNIEQTSLSTGSLGIQYLHIMEMRIQHHWIWREGMLPAIKGTIYHAYMSYIYTKTYQCIHIHMNINSNVVNGGSGGGGGDGVGVGWGWGDGVDEAVVGNENSMNYDRRAMMTTGHYFDVALASWRLKTPATRFFSTFTCLC